MIELLIILTTIIVAVLAILDRRKSKVFWGSLENTKRLWRQAYPNDSEGEISAFIHTLVDSLNLPDEARSKISPDHTLQEVYGWVYGQNSLTLGKFELKDLSVSLANEYSAKLEDIWYEGITAGKLYDLARKA